MRKRNKKVEMSDESKKLYFISVLKTYCEKLTFRDNCEFCRFYKFCNSKKCYGNDFRDWDFEDLKAAYESAGFSLKIHLDPINDNKCCEWSADITV